MVGCCGSGEVRRGCEGVLGMSCVVTCEHTRYCTYRMICSFHSVRDLIKTLLFYLCGHPC